MNTFEKSIEYLPPGLAIEILDGFYGLINEPGVNQSDLSEIVLKLRDKVEKNATTIDYYQMIAVGKEIVPKNFCSIVSNRLKDKGIILSDRYISMCLSDKSEKYNQSVVDEFITLVKECNDHKNKSFESLLNVIS